MLNIKSIVLSGFLLGAVVTTANAADALSINLTASQIVNQNGKAVLKPITKANSGDMIQYTATYRNNIDKPMTDVAITLPIPANMSYTGTSDPAPTLASLDGKEFQAIPLKRMVNGKAVEVPASEYRAVRWLVKYLPAQKAANVTLKAQVR